jgi:hypothetical protein
MAYRTTISVATPETTVRLGCDECPGKRSLRFPYSAVATLGGVDTSQVPMVATEEIAIDVTGRVIATYEQQLTPECDPSNCYYGDRIEKVQRALVEHANNNG